jgi:DNA-directed RNA polymerase subunit M/transcription elongation factor TFIIS
VAISRLGGCPKCKGFLMMEKDTHGLYQQCLQCGYIRDLSTIDPLDEQKAQQKTEGEASTCTSVDGSNETAENIEVDDPQYETILGIGDKDGCTTVN